jgi:large subunit ribosomal protein L30
MSKKLKIQQVRSGIGRLEAQKRTLKALGLGKVNRSVFHDDLPSIRGMIRTVRHLVTVEEVDGE